ncbi:MAG: cellulase family glycosylhydrolase [bacterium]|nr:MAG: cellulase family glycosylhydrolase [bacterium]
MTGQRRIWLFILMIIFIFSFNSESIASFLKASGQDIVDSTGTPILLRGYGLGGWLVPEGYMLHVPGYGSPSYIDSLIRDLVGNLFADQFWSDYRQNYVTKADIDLIAQWGFNSVRLPFHYQVFYDDLTSTFRPEGFALLDTLLNWCEDNQLYVILDMHCAPGGQNKDNISDSDGIEARLWTQPQIYQPLTIKIWKEIAQRYAADPRIGGYDFINEPVLPQGYSNQVLRDFYVQLTDTVRSVDSNHLIFVEGNWYATDFNLLTPPWDNNMSYSFHKYWNLTTIATIQYLIDIRNQYNVPLWMGESGENSNPWYYETRILFENNNIGWCWWAHKKLETITSPLSAIIEPEYQAILNYWSGSASRPSQSVALAALLQMADNLKLQYCESRPGVLRALFDADFGNQSRPFTTLNIPGTIPAVHYDFGTIAVGYSDSEFKNVGGPGGGEWNRGWRYRNDGVDIEHSSDPQGYAYNVGWIEDNEWLKYTVNIANKGIYRADFRVASTLTGGQIRIYINNQPISDIHTVFNTGGWQNWTTLSIEDLPLEAGQQEMIISFPKGGFNLNQIAFTFISSDIKGSDHRIPHDFELKQNYPNPFNASTRIQYFLPEENHVSLTVYDNTGQEISVLVNEKKRAGGHSIPFHSEFVSSGIYFYKIQVEYFEQTRKMLILK